MLVLLVPLPPRVRGIVIITSRPRPAPSEGQVGGPGHIFLSIRARAVRSLGAGLLCHPLELRSTPLVWSAFREFYN